MSKRRSLPDSLSLAQFENIYRGELEKRSDELITEIRTLLAAGPNPDVTGANIEVFADLYGDGVISIGMYFDGRNKKVDKSDESIYPGRHIAIADNFRDLPLIDVQAYEEEFSTPDITVDLIKTWLSECWWKAGGWDYVLEVNVEGHDGYGNGNVILLSKGQ